MSRKAQEHHPRKRFGQHFLSDQSIIAQLVAAIAPRRDDCMVEIGPGLGALTHPLIKILKHLHTVELDRDLAARLRELARVSGQITVHEIDALAFDFASLHEDEPLRIVGNLPYNISTPLMFHLLDSSAPIADMHFMLQREVVMRLAAQTNTRAYGKLSVMMQYQCEVDWLFDVPPQAFTPPPKVDSAVVRLVPRRTPPADVGDLQAFERLVHQAFSQRRKTLRNTLRPLLNVAQIQACDVDPGDRAESLDLQAFARLSRTLSGTFATQ
ncbi:MAG: 16S rRNA (adenine(1518)-N(6)/adenine(1519)-N(6))-dimethyltransferase RsmA [Pseudomonadota bacterium]